MGLEHHRSSLNCIKADSLTDESQLKERAATLLPHELVHAWCGKYRRPKGMYRTNYHESKQTNLLWVYEGLTQYLGHVLAVRSDLLSWTDELEMMAGRLGYMSNRAGRAWRSLEDTAIAGHSLRGGSKRWNDLRRSQDYYDEGALVWMEIDVRLREGTDGKYSLDDFCRRFFAVPANDDQSVRPFELDEIVQTLNDLYQFDWQRLLETRILGRQSALAMDAIERGGYKFEFSPERPAAQKRREKEREYISAEHSLGLTLDANGEISGVIPNGLADKAALTEGIKVIGVNMKKFDEDQWRHALQQTLTSGRMELLLLDGDTYSIRTIRYSEGPRYPKLVRSEDQPDRLNKIFSPQ